jgi:hypothetical protein
VRAVLAASGLVLLAGAAPAADMRSVTDSAGRRAELPARVERVYAAGGPASIFLYTLAPEKMLGWTRPLGPEERAFVPARYADLPTLGRLTGRGNTANVEVVLAARPDLIFDYGSLTETYRSLADRTQQQTGVPYLSSTGASPLSPVCTRAWAICSARATAAASSAGTRSGYSPKPTGALRACPPRSGPACIMRGARRASTRRRAAPLPWRASSGWARATWPTSSAAG